MKLMKQLLRNIRRVCGFLLMAIRHIAGWILITISIVMAYPASWLLDLGAWCMDEESRLNKFKEDWEE